MTESIPPPAPTPIFAHVAADQLYPILRDAIRREGSMIRNLQDQFMTDDDAADQAYDDLARITRFMIELSPVGSMIIAADNADHEFLIEFVEDMIMEY